VGPRAGPSPSLHRRSTRPPDRRRELLPPQGVLTGMNRRILLVALALAAVAAACGSGSGSGGTSAARGELKLRVFAGPVCPVETEPPTPGCEPRAVERAQIVLDGPEHLTIDVRDGLATVDVPPGTYQVVPRPVSGLMGTAPPTTVKIVAGRTTPLQLSYDTGIR
jgi:hypothetical protein